MQVLKKIWSLWKYGHRRPSLIFLVIASPQKLLRGFEWNLPVSASMSSCASTKPNSGRSTNFRTNLSDVWRIRTYLSHMWKNLTNSSQVWQILANSNDFFTGVTNTCEFFTRLKLDIGEKLVPIKISELGVRIFHTYQNVTYSWE